MKFAAALATLAYVSTAQAITLKFVNNCGNSKLPIPMQVLADVLSSRLARRRQGTERGSRHLCLMGRFPRPRRLHVIRCRRQPDC